MSEIPYGRCHCGCGGLTNLSPETNSPQGYVKGEPRRYINGHQRHAQIRTPEERFWTKVEKTATCWNWTAFISGGYGRHYIAADQTMQAHRFAYEALVGPIPDGLVLDHLCRNPACVNPAHLEPVTHRENVLRGARGRLITHCPQGHEYTSENTYRKRDTGHRSCRACGAESARRGRSRRRLSRGESS